MTSSDTPNPATATKWMPVRLIEPTPDGFLLVAISTGPWRVPPALPRPRRRKVLAQLRQLAIALEAQPEVEESSVFEGTLRPPGNRSLAGQWSGPVEYDAVMLVRTSTPQAARALLDDERVREVSESVPNVLATAGRNVRRIADVNHQRQGVFLFNFFTADDQEQNLHAWQYTAGWFQDETNLDNSTVLGDLSNNSPFALVNHCRWDHLIDVVPSLIAKRSFTSFVLETFRQHRVAPHPALYRLHFSTAQHG